MISRLSKLMDADLIYDLRVEPALGEQPHGEQKYRAVVKVGSGLREYVLYELVSAGGGSAEEAVGHLTDRVLSYVRGALLEAENVADTLRKHLE